MMNNKLETRSDKINTCPTSQQPNAVFEKEAENALHEQCIIAAERYEEMQQLLRTQNQM